MGTDVVCEDKLQDETVMMQNLCSRAQSWPDRKLEEVKQLSEEASDRGFLDALCHVEGRIVRRGKFSNETALTRSR